MSEHVSKFSKVELREDNGLIAVLINDQLLTHRETEGEALIAAGRHLEAVRKGRKRVAKPITGLVMNIRSGSNEIHKVPAPRGACHSDKIAPEYALKRAPEDLDKLMREPGANLCWFCFGIDSRQ